MTLSASKTREYLDFAHQLADAARKAILPYFRQDSGITNKGAGLIDYDPVTMADKNAELAMRDLIKAKYPNDSIIGEEYDDTIGTSGIEWVIDPIDGTRAFIAGTSSWGVLIGGYYNKEPIFGILDQPFTGDRWEGDKVTKQARHYCAGKSIEIKSNQNANFGNCVLSTTDPFLFNEPETEAFLNIRKRVPLVRYGLDCTAYSLLAHGSIGMVIETGLKLVDIGALIPIVEAAGGIFTDWHGNPNPSGGQVIASANIDLHTKALAILKPAAIQN